MISFLRSQSKFFAVLGLCALVWHVPSPTGMETKAWHLIIVFVATISLVVLKVPNGIIALSAITVTALTGLGDINSCLADFGTPLVWLIVLSFFIARGFIITGLGERIAYCFTSIFGRHVLGLSYGFTLTEVILGSAVPSNTARGAGIMFPIVRSLADEFDQSEKGQKHSLGSFLMKIGFHANVISCSMFLTAVTGNPLAAAFAKDLGITISWGTWALAASVPGLVCVILMPLVVYFLYPPKIKKLPHARAFAKQRLLEMGPMSSQQLVMCYTLIGLILLWIFGHTIGVNATVTAMLGIVVLLVTNVLSWDDVIKESTAWNMYVWFGTLIMLGGQLEKSGAMRWIGANIASSIQGTNWLWAFGIVTLVYFYTHYFFASTTALVTAMFAIFLQVLHQMGGSGFGSAMMLGAFGCLSSCLTHYGTGPAPVYFGTQYVPMKDWWTLGFILSLVYIPVWWVLGWPWWNCLGLL